MNSICEIDRQFVAGTYQRFPVTFTSGKGSLLYDAEGKEYIDLGTGIAVNSFGIGDEIWKKAVTGQLEKLQHTSNLYYTEPCARLAQMLCSRTGFRKVFFSNSGAEANECAIKTARKYAAEHKGKECQTIITLRNSFHGRTITTLAATGQDHYHELFQPLTPGFVHVPANDCEALEQMVRQVNPAAILMECIQGEGGVIPLEPSFVRTAADLARKTDTLLMIDEVQTGNGRTGKLYAYMNYGIQPDIISTAKGLGGGLPLGATLLGEKVQDTLHPGDHGSTFGGNPVCCAGALSILSRLTDDFLSEVTAKSARFAEKLRKLPGVESVTGMGFMLGLKTTKPAKEIVMQCLQNGLLCLTAKDKVRLLPALNIPEELLEKALVILKEALV